MNKSFEGVTLDEKRGTVTYRREGGSLAGVRASVETAGEVERRFTATRLALMGPFALAFKKNKDKRELYLTVESPSFQFVVPCDPKKGEKARQFAAAVNTAAARIPAQREVEPAPVGDDVLEQVRKLGELRAAGLLSEAEFEAKKAELLKRL